MATLIELQRLIECADHGATLAFQDDEYDNMYHKVCADEVLTGHMISTLCIKPPELTPEQSDAWEWTGEYCNCSNYGEGYAVLHGGGVPLTCGANRSAFGWGYILHRKEQIAGTCTVCGGPVYHRDNKPGEYDHDCDLRGNTLNADGYCDRDGWRAVEPEPVEVRLTPADVDAYIASRQYTEDGIKDKAPMHDRCELMEFYEWLAVRSEERK